MSPSGSSAPPSTDHGSAPEHAAWYGAAADPPPPCLPATTQRRIGAAPGGGGHRGATRPCLRFRPRRRHPAAEGAPRLGFAAQGVRQPDRRRRRRARRDDAVGRRGGAVGRARRRCRPTVDGGVAVGRARRRRCTTVGRGGHRGPTALPDRRRRGRDGASPTTALHDGGAGRTTARLWREQGDRGSGVAGAPRHHDGPQGRRRGVPRPRPAAQRPHRETAPTGPQGHSRGVRSRPTLRPHRGRVTAATRSLGAQRPRPTARRPAAGRGRRVRAPTGHRAARGATAAGPVAQRAGLPGVGR